MKPELKRYYLMHAAYWCQQSIVMGFGLEKPRKDYYELIAHHAVTLWLIGYVKNHKALCKFSCDPHKMELLDEHDAHRQCGISEYGPPRRASGRIQMFELPAMGNYQDDRVCHLHTYLDVRVFSFCRELDLLSISYFRVWLNLRMLWSVWNEFYLAPYVFIFPGVLISKLKTRCSVIGDRWYPERGEWLVPWMRYQMFAPILLLLIINLFWTFLILRIAYR
jgi:acyl-CoA-dependent ceramide synthase